MIWMCKASELFLVNFIVYDPISSAKCNLFQQQDTPVCSVHIIKILTCLSIGTTQYYIMAYQNPHYKDFVLSVGPKKRKRRPIMPIWPYTIWRRLPSQVNKCCLGTIRHIVNVQDKLLARIYRKLFYQLFNLPVD